MVCSRPCERSREAGANPARSRRCEGRPSGAPNRVATGREAGKVSRTARRSPGTGARARRPAARRHDDASRGRRTRWRELASTTWPPRWPYGPRSAWARPRPRPQLHPSTSRCGWKVPHATVTQSTRCRSRARSPATSCPAPTALGALLAAGKHHHFPVGLQWFDCCGFFVNSVAGVPGDATHFWAFKVGHALSAVGAGAVTATPGLSVLFYYTTFDPNTGATEPTLGHLAGQPDDRPRRHAHVRDHVLQRRRPPLRGRRRLGERRRDRHPGRLDRPPHRPVHARGHVPGAGNALRRDPLADGMGARHAARPRPDGRRGRGLRLVGGECRRAGPGPRS